MFTRVGGYMGVDRKTVHLGFWMEERSARRVHPIGSLVKLETTSGAGGYYVETDGIGHIRVNAAEFKDPQALISTMATNFHTTYSWFNIGSQGKNRIWRPSPISRLYSSDSVSYRQYTLAS
jgi:hypothetical protein